jgi:hypothetical protein
VKCLLADPRFNINDNFQQNSDAPLFRLVITVNYEQNKNTCAILKLLIEDPNFDPKRHLFESNLLGYCKLYLDYADEVTTAVRQFAVTTLLFYKLIQAGITQEAWNKDHIMQDVFSEVIYITAQEKESCWIKAMEMANNPEYKRRALWQLTPESRQRTAEYFALMLFYADDLVSVPANAPEATKRFFTICKQFPMELQMVEANRMEKSSQTNVSGQELEKALRQTAKSFSN